MQTIVSIEYVEECVSKRGKKYWLTHALLSDGDLAVGFGKNYDLDDKVIVFFTYGQIRMKKYILK